MNSEPISPSSAETTPTSAIRLPGVWLIWIRCQEYEVVEGHRPEPVGQRLGLADAEVDAVRLPALPGTASAFDLSRT